MYMRNRKIAESEEEGAIRMAISLLAYKEIPKKSFSESSWTADAPRKMPRRRFGFAVEKNYLCEERYFQRGLPKDAQSTVFSAKEG